jgi:hypothetical protein
MFGNMWDSKVDGREDRLGRQGSGVLMADRTNACIAVGIETDPLRLLLGEHGGDEAFSPG